jgi:hypothetical protein
VDHQAGSPKPADRLEAALERIARVATAGIIRAGRAEAPAASAVPPEAVERLDALITRLHAALDEHPDVA